MTQQAPAKGLKDSVYRLGRFDVEVGGRRREFGRSLFLVSMLLLIQQPFRSEALAGGNEARYIDPVVALRISLILDCVFIISYFVLAYRAWGLVRAFRAPRRLTNIVRTIAYFVVPVLAALDVFENIHLWQAFPEGSEVTSLTWGPSNSVLVVGLGVALGVSLIMAVLADPRLYWKRQAGTLSRRRMSPRWRRRLRLSAGSDARPWWLQALVWLLGSRDLARWKSVLAPEPNGSCTCGGNQPVQTSEDDERSWGVICCSGGGVRSAAFSLGALQVLNKHSIYEKTDAVVGVSGGGYTSTAYHVLRWQSGDSTEQQVDHEKVWDLDTKEAFRPESPELHWLRRHTHYVLDSLRVAVHGGLTLAFGIAVNLVLLAVALGTSAWILAWVFLASGTLTPPKAKTEGVDEAGSIALELGGDWWSLQHLWIVPVIGVGAFLLERAWDRFFTVGHRWRTILRNVTTAFLTAGVVLYLLLLGLPALIAALFDYADTSGDSYARLIYALGIVPQEHCQAVIDAADQAAEAAGKEANQAACGVKSTPESETTGIPAASIVTIVTSILAVLASVKGASKGTEAASGVRGVFTKVWAKIKDPVVPWLAVILIVAACLVQLVRWTAVLSTQPARLGEWKYALGAAIVLILLKVFSEPNRTSLHHFFRERISFAFLVRRRYQRIRSMPYREPLRFSQSRPPEDKGPRLVTCAVANASDPTLVPSQRGCTPFVFDDEEIGLTDRLLPEAAGRRGSATYEFAADYAYRDATIPAAVAMSAAAFSPLAGRENVRVGPFRAVLALGNARLGVWLPNPLWIDAASLAKRQARIRDADFVKTWQRLSCRDAKDLWGRLGTAQPWAHETLTAACSDVPVAHAGVWDASHAPDPDQSRKARLRAKVRAVRMKVVPMTKGYPPRPRGVRLFEMGRTVFKKPGMTRVVREAVGHASIYDRFLYVTDGGHYDNLGLIEALRRRPRRIFAIDASNDAEDTFRALGLAVATARMDLDCELKMDPRPMRRIKEQRSAAGWCTGTATFADGTTCAVYLVKAIMLDDMPWDVETYAASNLDFPRTSTGKQLYSEFDFEAYRMLGLRAVEELLDSVSYLNLEATTARAEAAAARAAEAARNGQ